MSRVHTLVCTFIAAAVVLAPVAHADDASYLAQVRGTGGLGVAMIGDPQLLSMGHMACERMRSGTTADELKAINIANGPLVDAAQHELCPDTL